MRSVLARSLFAFSMLLTIRESYGIDRSLVVDSESDGAQDHYQRAQNGKKMIVTIEGAAGGEILYAVSDDNLREGRANGRPRGRARPEDPFGGCRLRCPKGFNPQDYHIHIHKWNRPVNKGGIDPLRGVYHHDWKERAQ